MAEVLKTNVVVFDENGTPKTLEAGTKRGDIDAAYRDQVADYAFSGAADEMTDERAAAGSEPGALIATQSLEGGGAAPAGVDPQGELQSMSKDDLKSYAEAKGVVISSGDNKSEIIAKITSAQ